MAQFWICFNKQQELTGEIEGDLEGEALLVDDAQDDNSIDAYPPEKEGKTP